MRDLKRRNIGAVSSNKQAKAYEVAADIRKFEIELYWKRATYFCLMIGFIYSAYFSKDTKDFAKIVLALLGFSISLSWFFVNKGSKFWQINWENKLRDLEESQTGPLYGKLEVSNKDTHPLMFTKAYRYSVSNVNLVLSGIITLSWVFIVVFQLLNECNVFDHFKNKKTYLIITLIGMISVFVFLFFAGKSHDKK